MEDVLGQKECQLRKGRGCVDQVFTMRQLSERCISKGKSLYGHMWVLRGHFNGTDREAMWWIMRMHSVNDDIIRGIKTLYEGSKPCVSACKQESNWFSFRMSLHQDCFVSHWLFNTYLDGLTSRNCKWKAEWMMFALVGDKINKK